MPHKSHRAYGAYKSYKSYKAYKSYGAYRAYRAYGAYLVLLLLLALTACTADEEPTTGGAATGPTLTLHIGVATGESFLQTRATDVGDPGTAETFRNPRYLYVFLYDVDKGKSYCVYEGTNSQGEVVNICHDMSDIKPISHAYWSEGTHDYAPLPTEGDRILHSTLGIDLSTLTERGSTARLYVAASYWEFNNIGKGTGNAEELITKIQFDVPKHSPSYSSVIRDIYSTPYNLTSNGTSSGTYYGTIPNFNSTEKIDKEIILYHVGAKLDLNWNIPEELHSAMWLSDMELSDMKNRECYLFRPMENTSAGSGKYDEGSLSGEGGPIITPGNQWYGRHVFYVIPYFSDPDNRVFKFKMQLWRNGLTQAGYEAKYLEEHPAASSSDEDIKAAKEAAANAASDSGYEPSAISVPVDQDLADIFTPWMLGRLTITSQFKHHNEK